MTEHSGSSAQNHRDTDDQRDKNTMRSDSDASSRGGRFTGDRGDRGERRERGYGERNYGDRDNRGERENRRGYDNRDNRGDRYGDRDQRAERGERRSYGDRNERGYDNRDRRYNDRDQRRSYGDRDNRDNYNRGGRGEGSYGNRDNRGYGNRDNRDDRRGYGARDNRGDRYGDRDNRDQRRSYGDRDNRDNYSRDNRRGYDNRNDRGERGERRYNDRDQRRPYGDRDNRDNYNRGERRPYGDRGDRNERGERRSYGDRPQHRNSGGFTPQRGGKNRQGEQRSQQLNPQRSGFREERINKRHHEPPIPEDISPKDLDTAVRQELLSLTKENADMVAKHLIMAALLLDKDPQQALVHARCAKDRAGRVAVARETCGITAYHCGEWKEAIAELRAARRLSGGPGLLPVLADAERGLGRPEKALEVANDPQAADLDEESQVELAIVVAGAYQDLGNEQAALGALEAQLSNTKAPEVNIMRLRYAYADLLEHCGRVEDAIEQFRAAGELDSEEVLDVEERLETLTAGASEGASADTESTES